MERICSSKSNYFLKKFTALRGQVQLIWQCCFPYINSVAINCNELSVHSNNFKFKTRMKKTYSVIGFRLLFNKIMYVHTGI